MSKQPMYCTFFIVRSNSVSLHLSIMKRNKFFSIPETELAAMISTSLNLRYPFSTNQHWHGFALRDPPVVMLINVTRQVAFPLQSGTWLLLDMMLQKAWKHLSSAAWRHSLHWYESPPFHYLIKCYYKDTRV